MGKELRIRNLDETVINEFRELVRKKYRGRLHTVFGLEVEKALREYLKREGYSDIKDTHTHINQSLIS